MTNGNEPANPVTEETTDRVIDGVTIYTGLTKREHFAAMAMQGYCSNLGVGKTQNGANNISIDLVAIADLSVRQADSLINALNK